LDDNYSENTPKTKKVLLFYEKYMLTIGILGQLMFYTQGFKIFLRKSANDISLLGFTLGLICVASWLLYGILIKNKVLIISNVVATIGAIFVIIGVLMHSS
jgi:MtN3 and saliva related transmembrane protein